MTAALQSRGDTAYDDLAEIYDQYAGAAARTVWRLGVGAEVARLATGAPSVLDVGAGTGIGAEIISELVPGADVVSLDASAEMLSRGGVPPERRIVADMADFTVAPRQFDFVVSGFDSLNYLAPDRLADCLACVADALRPGGYLIFDYCSRRFLHTDAQEGPATIEVGDLRLHRSRHAFEAPFARSRTFLSLYRDEELVWRQTHTHYAVDPFALEELARGDGLETLSIRNLADERFTPGQATHVYVMQRVR